MAVVKPGTYLAEVVGTDKRSRSVTFLCGRTPTDWKAKPGRLYHYVCPALMYRVHVDHEHQVSAWVPVVPSTKTEITRWLRFCGVKSPAGLVKEITEGKDKVTASATKAMTVDAPTYLASIGANEQTIDCARRWLPAGLIPLGNRMLDAEASAKEIFATLDHLLSKNIAPDKWGVWLDEHAFELIEHGVSFGVLDRLIDADEAMRSFGAVRFVLYKKEQDGHIGGLLVAVYKQASSISGLDTGTIRAHVGIEGGKYKRRFWITKRQWTNKDGSLRHVDGTVGAPLATQPRWIISEPISLREKSAAEGLKEFSDRPVRQAMRMGSLPATFDADQLQIADAISKYRITVVLGPAGTGKTKAIREIGEALANQGQIVAMTATTGRAAQALHADGMTVHSFLGVLPGDFKSYRRTQDATVLIIDESSMLDNTLAGSLGTYLKFNSSIERLILVGDPYQLPPVGVGKVLADMSRQVSPLHHKVIELTKVHRTTSPGILGLATAIRNRQPLPPVSQLSGVHVLDTSQAFAADLVRSFVEKFLAKPRASLNDLMIIAPVNDGEAGVKSLNAIVRDLHLGKSDDDWIKGQRVIQTHNYKEEVDPDSPPIIIANGTFGTVMDVDDDGGVLVRYDGFRQVEKRWNDYECIPGDGYLEGGYVLSVHRAQGQQADHVIVMADSDPGSQFMWSDPALGYTAVTRAQRSLTIVGDYGMVGGDITKYVDDRASFLLERIAVLVYGTPGRGGNRKQGKGLAA